MEIVPYYGQQPLASDQVLVRVNPEDLHRCHKLVEQSKASVPKVITNPEAFQVAKRMAGHLRGMLAEIAAAKKEAKAPFNEVTEQINAAASGLVELVETEHRAVLATLNAYVAQLEAAKREAERKRAEAHRLEQEALARRIAEAKAAENLQALQRAELEAELGLVELDLKPRALVPGGRVDHRYKFELSDLKTLLASGRTDLLRWSIDHYACLDEVRAQLGKNPDVEPVLPGIKITREISVSVKPP